MSLSFDDQGVRFTFTLPVDVLVEINADTALKQPTAIGRIDAVANGRHALLIEDNVVLAMDMVDSLSRLGTERVETAGTLETALFEIERQNFDFAILDMNLRGVVSYDIARKLLAKGTPFAFVTGYGSTIDVPHDLRDVPIYTKPVDEATLSRAIEGLLKG